jgi:hypothetical protein
MPILFNRGMPMRSEVYPACPACLVKSLLGHLYWVGRNLSYWGGIAPQEHPKGFNWGLPRGIAPQEHPKGFNWGGFNKGAAYLTGVPPGKFNRGDFCLFLTPNCSSNLPSLGHYFQTKSSPNKTTGAGTKICPFFM